MREVNVYVVVDKYDRTFEEVFGSLQEAKNFVLEQTAVEEQLEILTELVRIPS